MVTLEVVVLEVEVVAFEDVDQVEVVLEVAALEDVG